MIVGSLLILVAAAGLLVTGLMQGSDAFLIGSIVASLFAGVGLYIGARARRRVDDDDEVEEPEPPRRFRPDDRAALRGYGDAPRAAAYDDEPEPSFRGTAGEQLDRRAPVVGTGYGSARDDFDEGTPEPRFFDPASERGLDDGEPEVDLSDEPAPMPINRVDRTRLANLRVSVHVVDGRPRYHLPGCVHLLGKEDEPIAVNEAVELGFTPCGLCEPTADVLAELSVRSSR